MAPTRFELVSPDSKSDMIDRYTMGLIEPTNFWQSWPGVVTLCYIVTIGLTALQDTRLTATPFSMGKRVVNPSVLHHARQWAASSFSGGNSYSTSHDSSLADRQIGTTIVDSARCFAESP